MTRPLTAQTLKTQARRLALSPANFAVLGLQGWVADRFSDRGMVGAGLLAHAVACRLGVNATLVGAPSAPEDKGFRHALAGAEVQLSANAAAVDEAMRARATPLIFANRCAATLSTIAAALRHQPEMCVIWVDAHGDYNTPKTTPTGYLGGMVISALCAEWDTGHGAGLSPDRVLMAGVRDLDTAEADLIAARKIVMVPPDHGALDIERIVEFSGTRPVWLHIDCDAIDPAFIPAEYQIPGGLTPGSLRALVAALSRSTQIAGIEMTEFEAPVDPTAQAPAVATLLDILEPALTPSPAFAIG